LLTLLARCGTNSGTWSRRFLLSSSCGTIRLSDRLEKLPKRVRDCYHPIERRPALLHQRFHALITPLGRTEGPLSEVLEQVLVARTK